MEGTQSKLQALNTIALWIITLVVVGYLVFKPTNNISKDTVDRLADVVTKLGVASENMTKLADSQREWFTSLQQQALKNELKRNNEYSDVYKNNGYLDPQDSSVSLNDLYNSRLRTEAQDNGRGYLRGLQSPDSKAGVVQEPAGHSKG